MGPKRGAFWPFVFLLLCHAFLACPHVQGQNPSHIIYDETQGVTTREFYEVIQGPDGNMFFSSELGLFRFDGESFHTLLNPLSQSKKRKGSIFKVRPYQDKLLLLNYSYPSRLWLMENDSVFVPFCGDSVQIAIVHRFFNNMQVDTSGAVMFTTYSSNGVAGRIDKHGDLSFFRCDLSHGRASAIHLIPVAGTNKWVSYTCAPNLPNLQFPEGVIFSDTTATPVRHESDDIVRKSPIGWTIQLRHIDQEGILSGNMFSRSLEFRNELWVSVSRVLVCKNLKSGKEHFTTLPSEINTIDSMADGTVLIGTNNGLYIRHPQDEILEHVFRDNAISDCFEDDEGGLWITTLDRGIFYVPCLQIRRIGDLVPPNLSLNAMAISNKWLALLSDYQGFYGLKKQGNQWVGFNETQRFFSRTKRMQFSSDDSLFIGASRFVLNTGYKERFKSKTVLDLTFFRGEFWSLGWKNSLSNHDQNLDMTWEGIGAKCLSKTDDDSTLLIGTNKGIFHFDPTTKISSPYRPETFKDLDIEYMVRGDSGELLVLTLNDVFWLRDGQKFHLPVNSSKNVMFSNCAVIASDSICWVGTVDGLYRVQILDTVLKAEYMGSSLGLPDRQVTALAYRRDTLFVGMEKGVWYFNSKTLPRLFPEPKVTISHVGLRDSLFEAMAEVELTPLERDVDFFFRAPTFRPGMDVAYAYRLVGYQDEWKMTKEDHASYFNLPPGAYQFEVKSKCGKRGWSDHLATLNVTIEPRFTERTWVRVAGMAAGLLFMAILMYVYFRSRDRQRANLLRNAQAELKALSLEINPHFLYNALNTIHYLTGESQKKKLDQFLGGLSRLTRSILEHSRQLLISLDTELQSLEDYLKLEQARFGEHPFQYHIEVDQALRPEQIFVPPLLIQPIVENALWHGLYPSKLADKRVEIRCEKKGESLVITISDNGVGREHSPSAAPGHPVDHARSIGIKNTQERLQLFEQMGFGKAQITLTDLYSTEGQTMGTCATFVLTPARKR